RRKTLQFQKIGRKVPGPHVGFHAWIQKIQGNLEKRLRAGPQVEKVAMPGERPLKAQVTRVGIGEWEGLPKRHATKIAGKIRARTRGKLPRAHTTWGCSPGVGPRRRENRAEIPPWLRQAS